MKINYFIDGLHKTAILASVDEVVELVQILNSTNSIYVHIYLDTFDIARKLTLIGGNPSRRIVIAKNLSNSQGILVSGRLIDQEISFADGEISFESEDGKSPDMEPLRTTVSIEKAFLHISFIVINNKVPDNSYWEQRNTNWGINTHYDD